MKTDFRVISVFSECDRTAKKYRNKGGTEKLRNALNMRRGRGRNKLDRNYWNLITFGVFFLFDRIIIQNIFVLNIYASYE